MRSGMIEVRHVLMERSAQVVPPEEQQVIQALASRAAEDVLTDRVGARRPVGRPERGNACAGYVRRLTRLPIPRAAARSSEEAGFWVAHRISRRKLRETAAWWGSENSQKMPMAGIRKTRAIR